MNSRGNPKVWKISPGKSHFQWRRGTWQSEKVIAIGWEEVGNLDNFKTIDELRAKTKKEGLSKAGYVANQLWSFKQVEEGDIVVAYGNYTILDIGIVKGPYFLSIDGFVKPNYNLYGHRKPVTWLKLGPVPIRNPKIERYMAQNNTIFQIIDNDTLRFIRDLLEKSYHIRIVEKLKVNCLNLRGSKSLMKLMKMKWQRRLRHFQKFFQQTKKKKRLML